MPAALKARSGNREAGRTGEGGRWVEKGVAWCMGHVAAQTALWRSKCVVLDLLPACTTFCTSRSHTHQQAHTQAHIWRVYMSAICIRKTDSSRKLAKPKSATRRGLLRQPMKHNIH